jgi:hypothetical protein
LSEFLSPWQDRAPQDIGWMEHLCDHCQALHWADESTGTRSKKGYYSYYAKGAIALPGLKALPLILRALFEGQDL